MILLLVWLIAALTVVLGWRVVWEEVFAAHDWPYRVGLVIAWAAVTYVVGAAYP